MLLHTGSLKHVALVLISVSYSFVAPKRMRTKFLITEGMSLQRLPSQCGRDVRKRSTTCFQSGVPSEAWFINRASIKSGSNT